MGDAEAKGVDDPGSGEPKLVRCNWTNDEVKVHEATERAERTAHAKETSAFRGYKEYGQERWLLPHVVCADFTMSAKQRVLEQEARERAGGGPGGRRASTRRRPSKSRSKTGTR